ncbi:MAG TPA: hypothetical protein VFS08_12580 [Gemmatimonadaceae bacterium]|nr:hypothetical protein [Gemmatimonadaceae bacterium]
MIPRRRARRPLVTLAAVAAVALILLACSPAPLHAQYLTRPELRWRTLRTEHFVFHFPAEMTAWTRDVAARAESVHDAVAALVGYAPRQPVRVLVEDPSNVSNGFALPFIGAPTLFLWPTPPDPSSILAHNRGWGEVLVTHEFAHVAHLTRPSRNARQRLLWRLLPVDLGPLARRAPRWVIEGYATYVEGILTGSGRPASAGRAAILRQWALEGQLPTYAQLNGSSRFLGGSMAYLVGSAYLDWLVDRAGEASLPHLWRRMSARADRGFVAAFVGVFGAPPEELYGRFTAELTGRALAVEDSLAARGMAEGELVQRLSLATGAPALSPDGSLLAIVLRRRDAPSRLVVWSTAPDTAAEARARRARDSLLARDPEDVPAVPGRPAPKRALFTLPAMAGRSHEQPRFLPDGEHLLVVRSVPQGDGSERPDLFAWAFRRGSLRRVTRGAGIREADPLPDGTAAVGVRCRGGICDLVRVSLRDGTVRTIVAGAPDVGYFRPRVAPDGREVLVSVHARGRWRLALVPVAGGPARFVGPEDDVSRYGADFLPGGGAVVATSERGGIMHLERIDLATGAAEPITRTSGAHIAPAIAPVGDTVYFLALHARGYDLRRVRATPLPGDAATLAAALYPALPPLAPPPAPRFATVEPPPDHPYGLGPRLHRLLPGVLVGPEGYVGIAALDGTDPVGRFAWLLQGAVGTPGSWQGAALAAELRTGTPWLRADLFALRHAPSRQREGGIARAAAGTALDVGYDGGALGASLRRDHGSWSYAANAGASAGVLDPLDDDAPRTGRTLARAGGTLGLRWQRDRTLVASSLGVRAAAGRTGDATWTRGRVDAALTLRGFGLGLRASAAVGVVSADAPTFERFAVGGQRPPLGPPQLLDQRWSVPTLPPAVAVGRRLLGYRGETDLLGLTAYVAAAGAGERWRAPHRVVGIERELALPAIAFVAVPAVRILGGVARSLDEPFRHRTRAYLSVSYDP